MDHAEASMSTTTVTLDVAGLVSEIQFPDSDWVPPLAERYAAFLAAGPADWRVTLLQDASVPMEEPGWIEHEGQLTQFHVYRYRGEIDLRAHTCSVTAPAPERAPSALERTLGYIYMQALPREKDALLLHACGIVIDGRGYVFFGPSGAGKTTVAKLAEGRGQLLTDENVVLRLTDDAVQLYSTPFWGHSTPPELIRRVNRRVPLAGLFALSHAPDFSLTRLSPGHAVAALLTTEKVATERVESAVAWLQVASAVVDRVPVYTLAFRPTPELWTFLARHNGEKLI